MLIFMLHIVDFSPHVEPKAPIVDLIKRNEVMDFLKVDKLLLFKKFSSEGMIRHMLIELNFKIMMYYPDQVRYIASELTRITNFHFVSDEGGLRLIGRKPHTLSAAA